MLTGFFTVLFRRKTSENFGLNFGLNETQIKILELIKKNQQIIAQEMANFIGVSRRSVELGIAELKKQGFIIRKGSRKRGYWEINVKL
ncbi:MAG: HTH domain-containing protein [Clostridiaceae bacterium]|nr:HTH domain-containing protein [Clostridiaceae bacterium]